MRRMLLTVTVPLVMAVMMMAMAMPVFAQAADPCETGSTPASPPDVGDRHTGFFPTPSSPPPLTPPGYAAMEHPDAQTEHRLGRNPFTGPNIFEGNRCENSL
jgi:hypothetical protein